MFGYRPQREPGLAGSREKIQELVADYQAARAKFFPRLVLTSYYDRQPPNRFTSGALTNQQLFKREGYTGVLGKQIIFDGFKTYYNTQAAQTGTQSQRQEVQRTADELAFTVTQAFYQLIEAKENLKVAQEALQQRQEFDKLTGAFYQAGKVTNLDYVRAQSQVSEAQQAVVEAQNAERLAQEILARTLGLQEQVPVDIKGKLPQEFAAAEKITSLWQEVLRSNPEIKKLDLDIAQSRTLIKAARGGYFPEVSLQAGSDVRHRDLGGTKPEWIGGASWSILSLRGADQGPGGQSLIPISAITGEKAGPAQRPQGGSDHGLEGPGERPPGGGHHQTDRGYQPRGLCQLPGPVPRRQGHRPGRAPGPGGPDRLSLSTYQVCRGLRNR